jgi:predicted ATP-grasp superfamily ATP-dependent carboligase
MITAPVERTENRTAEDIATNAPLTGPAKALVIGDDIGVFLAIARSLGRAGIGVDVATCGEDYPGLRSRYVRNVKVLPPYLSAPSDWLAELAKLVNREEYRLVLPSSDSSLDLLNAAAKAIDPRRLAIPNRAALNAFSNKAATRALAARFGVKTADGREWVGGDKLEVLDDSCAFPLVLKPARSYSVGDATAKHSVCIVRNEQELQEAGSALEGQHVLVEDFFEGDGVGVSVLAKHGAIRSVWQHRRLAATSSTGRSCRRTGEAPDPRLLRDVEALADATHLTGVAMFEFRQNPATGDHILIEVNPRFWGSLPLAVASGADFPLGLWHLHSGDDDAFSSGPIDRTLRKVDLSGEYDRISALSGSMTKTLGALARLLGLFAAAIVRPHLFDGWAKDDPAPHWSELRIVLGNLRDAARRRI